MIDGADGLTSLREAIIAANANAGTDTIILPAGTYTSTRAGASEDAALTGDLDITGSVDIVGAGAAVTTINGNSLDRVFEILSTTVVTMDGLTITGGSGTTSDGGGAIYSGSGTSLTIRNALFSGNSATGLQGGAIFTRGTLVMDKVRVTANSAAEGGGLYNYGIATTSATNSLFDNNTATADGKGWKRVSLIQRIYGEKCDA